MPEGTVLKSTGSWYIVRCDNGVLFNCRLKGKFKIQGIKTTNPIAVGDRISFSETNEAGIGQIEQIFDRKNYIIRKSVNLSKQTHIIASNIDQLVVIAAITNPRTSSGFIDRLCVTAEAYHITPVIVFNKYDLLKEKHHEKLDYILDVYKSVGYTTLVTSQLTGLNIDALKELLTGKTSLLSGHSGVGKSALINTVEPLLNLRTTQISDYNNKGKHTTTFAEMHPLSFGGYVIDTPGIKEFGIVDFSKEEVSHYFPEMRRLMHLCRFSNCSHDNEPGCAIKAAVETGELSTERYINYLNILNNEEAFEPDYD